MSGASASIVSETDNMVVEDGGFGGGLMEVNICLVKVLAVPNLPTGRCSWSVKLGPNAVAQQS